MKVILAVGVGSFLGGIARYLISLFIQGKVSSTFPFGTLTVNILGCLLIGLVFGIAERGIMSHEWRLFLATGILGGFTTFSAFSNESVAMLHDGQFLYASGYIFASVFIGLLATVAGILITKFF